MGFSAIGSDRVLEMQERGADGHYYGAERPVRPQLGGRLRQAGGHPGILLVSFLVSESDAPAGFCWPVIMG